ncbi:MAG: DUF4129 domain-containing protein [Actinomycetota bacterium]|nr:DUF4129 domain-containing protein [Actinomycetota bacterium]
MGDGGGRVAVAILALVAAAVPLMSMPGAWAVAGADKLSTEQLRTLAEHAASDPVALRRFAQVAQVANRSVDFGDALHRAQDEDLRSRPRALTTAQSGSEAGSGTDSVISPRDEARRILDGRKFQPAPTIRPFRGVLRRVGEWLRPIGEPLGRLWSRLAANAPGRVALAVAVVGTAALVSIALIRRRTGAGESRGGGSHERRGREDPDALDREADAAERAGNLERAFRLRFRAGLLRLDEAGVIVDHPALTTGELTRRVSSPRLRGLASAFEEITYGGRAADADDLRTARSDWPRVLHEVSQG